VNLARNSATLVGESGWPSALLVKSMPMGWFFGQVSPARKALPVNRSILLHGFPETSIMWAGLMERLGEEGYRCFAPDQRGYSPGARPGTVEDYQYRKLVSDVMAQADALGYARFHLIGHDWGSAIGWVILQRIRTACAVGRPCPVPI